MPAARLMRSGCGRMGLGAALPLPAGALKPSATVSQPSMSRSGRLAFRLSPRSGKLAGRPMPRAPRAKYDGAGSAGSRSNSALTLSPRLAVSQRRFFAPRSWAGPHCSFSNWEDWADLPTGAGMSIAMPTRSDSTEISMAPPFW
ncbi:hypothetical protein D3C71_1405830 [compost metagenome]